MFFIRYRYRHFELDSDVKPALEQLSKIRSSNMAKQEALPLEQWGVINPSEVGLNTLEELSDSEEYYEDQLGEVDSNYT